ncbi:hypothetical protein F5Y15DRAFT_304941 [Xylariaceae sp. FL0016]|nr:hypothetical protein F5Y15DRAFT_304941 [Xylariaceae sp. FL0016]
MGGQFTPYDPERCPHYAQSFQKLDRVHFDGLYWSCFLLVICALFLSSWIYQRTMQIRDASSSCDEQHFRRKLKLSIAITGVAFLIGAALLVVEVFALLALQFCDGEDLVSLYWSTWTMLQLGSEIAILGIVLALWHHLCDIQHPMWALALGTPVLVVAGFGHVMAVFLAVFVRKAKAKVRARGEDSGSDRDGASSSSSRREKDNLEGSTRHASVVEQGDASTYFTIDVGSDEAVRRWPSFVGMADGKAVVRLTPFTGTI